MRVRGALHVHSAFSHDGSLTIAELGRFYAQRGFQFIAIGEHSQDMDADKIPLLLEHCARVSDENFLALPGIEYTCKIPGMHILGVGVIAPAPDAHPLTAARLIRSHGGFSVLAHPRRVNWVCAPELLAEIDAVEIWNVGYDGKYLPPDCAPDVFRRMTAVNPQLLAVASHDLHRKPAFYNVSVEMEMGRLTREAVLERLRAGAFTIRSPYFSCGPKLDTSWAQMALVRFFSPQLARFRQARSGILYRTS